MLFSYDTAAANKRFLSKYKKALTTVAEDAFLSNFILYISKKWRATYS